MTETKAHQPSLPCGEPEAVGMSATRMAKIVTALNKEIEAGQLPGAVISHARRGHLVFHEAVGYLTPDRRTKMPRDALFAIASMTRPKCFWPAASSAKHASLAAKPSRSCGLTA